MPANKCPDCGSRRFYVKDPEDVYTIFEFDMHDGEIIPSGQQTDSCPLEVTEETETFCNRCAWHDTFKTLKRIR